MCYGLVPVSVYVELLLLFFYIVDDISFRVFYKTILSAPWYYRIMVLCFLQTTNIHSIRRFFFFFIGRFWGQGLAWAVAAFYIFYCAVNSRIDNCFVCFGLFFISIQYSVCYHRPSYTLSACLFYDKTIRSIFMLNATKQSQFFRTKKNRILFNQMSKWTKLRLKYKYQKHKRSSTHTNRRRQIQWDLNWLH